MYTIATIIVLHSTTLKCHHNLLRFLCSHFSQFDFVTLVLLTNDLPLSHSQQGGHRSVSRITSRVTSCHVAITISN